jgi:glycosidase
MWRVYERSDSADQFGFFAPARAIALVNNRRKIELLNTLLSMPGTPIIYWRRDRRLGDNFYLSDRNGCRTPMQWSPDRNGFSWANPQRLFLPVISTRNTTTKRSTSRTSKRTGLRSRVDLRQTAHAQKLQSIFALHSLSFFNPTTPRSRHFAVTGGRNRRRGREPSRFRSAPSSTCRNRLRADGGV